MLLRLLAACGPPASPYLLFRSARKAERSPPAWLSPASLSAASRAAAATARPGGSCPSGLSWNMLPRWEDSGVLPPLLLAGGHPPALAAPLGLEGSAGAAAGPCRSHDPTGSMAAALRAQSASKVWPRDFAPIALRPGLTLAACSVWLWYALDTTAKLRHGRPRKSGFSKSQMLDLHTSDCRCGG